MKSIATILLIFTCYYSYATKPYSEEIEIDELIETSEHIALMELISGKYERNGEKYYAELTQAFIYKGNSLKTISISHKHGWNRLEKLGGFYIIFLNKNYELMSTGSAIIPIEFVGGPFSGNPDLEKVADNYKLRKDAWFTTDNKLWTLKNCTIVVQLTCDREVEILNKTFNKAIHNDAQKDARM